MELRRTLQTQAIAGACVWRAGEGGMLGGSRLGKAGAPHRELSRNSATPAKVCAWLLAFETNRKRLLPGLR